MIIIFRYKEIKTDMTIIEKAIDLQHNLVKQINTYGKADDAKMTELIELCDQMSGDEYENFILRTAVTVEDTFNHDVETQSELNWIKNAMLGKL